MFSKHKRRVPRTTTNNYNKNIAVNLDEKGAQDSLKAAQIIFQRHINDDNNNSPKEDSISKKINRVRGSHQIPHTRTVPGNNSDTPTNNNNNNIPNPTTKRQQPQQPQQQPLQLQVGGEISRPTSRQTNRRPPDYSERNRLRQPSPLPYATRTSRSPSPSSGSGNVSGSSSSSRSASGSLYYNNEHLDTLTAPSPIINEKERDTSSSKTYKENNDVANIAASLAQTHIDSHIKPKKPSNVISDIINHGSKNKLTHRFALENEEAIINNLIEKSAQESQERQNSFIEYTNPANVIKQNVPRRKSDQSNKIPITTKNANNHISKESLVESQQSKHNQPRGSEEEQTIASKSSIHHRVPPPIFINSEALDSVASHSQNSTGPIHTQSVEDESLLDNLSFSRSELDQKSNISWNEDDYDGFSDNNGSFTNNYNDDGHHLEGYLTNEVAENKYLSDTGENQIHDYYSDPEGEADEDDDDIDDRFTLESLNEADMPPYFYSDDDDLDNDNKNHLKSPPRANRNKRRRVRRLGKILKATKNKVYSSDNGGSKMKKPTSTNNNNGQVRLMETMRYNTKKSFNEDKPWKKHKDVKYIEEHDRKRYEGVWVRNRYSYLNLLSWWPRDSVNKESDDEEKPDTPNEAADDSFLINLPEDGLILNLVVKAIWERSRLPDDLLCQIYKLVDTRKDSTLDRRSFIVGMWLVDQCLYGRKLPDEVPTMVWDSVDRYTMNVIQSRIENESHHKKKGKRKMMKRELKHIKSGMKHVHL